MQSSESGSEDQLPEFGSIRGTLARAIPRDGARRKRRQIAAGWLIAGHVVAALYTSSIARREPFILPALFWSLVFCQASLLGMWGGFGGMHWILRLAGAAIGTVVLWVAFLSGLGIGIWDIWILFMLFVTTSAVSLVTWGVQAVGIRPAFTLDDAASARARPQFSIRDLLLLTLVVACILMAATSTGSFVSGARELVVGTILGPCFATVGLASIWAVLGSGHLALRSVLLLPLAGASGWLGGRAAFGQSDWDFVFLTVLQAVWLFASLGVLRWAGYRLKRYR